MEAIKFENVYFSYKSDGENEQNSDVFAETAAFALNGVDLTVEEGEFVAVLGHNGSGKSTLARLCNALLTPKEGKISVFGIDTQEHKKVFEVRRQVGIVFQNPDNQTVASIVEDDIAFGPENVGIKRAEIGERIDFALKAVGMEEFRHATPTRLSGGQKQRIALAGVLALKPKVMILDESTAMLDPRGRKEVLDVVLRLNKEEKITVLLITHFPEEAMLADRAIVMHKGKIVLEGKPADVLAEEEKLKEYSLVLPRPLRVCRALTKNGLSTSDTMSENALAQDILNGLNQSENVRVPMQSKGAGTRLIDENEEIGGVRCENLSHVYNAKSAFATHALNGVSLQIHSGEFFGVIGHTGSGKSTFVQHLNALLKMPMAERGYRAKKPKKGKPVPPKTVLNVNGFDLTDKKTDFRALRGKVGMVFQYPEYQLFDETVYGDVAYGLKNFNKNLSKAEIDQAVREAIATVGLPYDEVAQRSPFELSGGQKRRVALAGVIVTKPEILVLDEPAAGLDPLGKEEIMSLLHKIHGDWCKTVIIVSHDMEEIAENCTRAAIFADGKVVSVDTPKGLFEKVSKMQELGLDVPFTARVCKALEKENVKIDCDYTVADFVQKTLAYIKTDGAGTRSTTIKGVADNA